MRFIVSCLILTPPHSPASHQAFLGNLTLSSEVLGHPRVFLLAACTWKPSSQLLINSVQSSCSVVSNSLWPHGLQHTSLPCPSPTSDVHPNPCYIYSNFKFYHTSTTLAYYNFVVGFENRKYESEMLLFLFQNLWLFWTPCISMGISGLAYQFL